MNQDALPESEISEALATNEDALVLSAMSTGDARELFSFWKNKRRITLEKLFYREFDIDVETDI